MRCRLTTLLLALLLFAVPTPALAANPFQRLAHRSFQGRSIVGTQGRHPVQHPADVDVFFRWVELNGYHAGTPTVYWNSGCNGHDYLLTVGHQRLHTYEEIKTQKQCTGQQKLEEHWLERFFVADPTWSLAEGRLTLASGPRRVILVGKWKLGTNS
ncbi:MAG TPA: hypothetical protein VJ204_10875 [Solirubrobacterales bacterium]|nr:hypothetical protein [Solirubrobacterales bacterium]